MAKQVQVKSPLFSLFLSALIPGLGQIYNGDTGVGILFILLSLISIPLFFIIIGYFLYAIVWIIAVITAYTGAQKANRVFIAQMQQQKPEKLD
ncbi:MAG: hypothetical protein WBD99_02065 [Thermodesulfobacteriota bacterium]